MEKIIKKTSYFLFILLSLSSCSGGSSGQENIDNSSTSSGGSSGQENIDNSSTSSGLADSAKLPSSIHSDYANYEAEIAEIEKNYGLKPISLNTDSIWYKSLSYPSTAIKQFQTKTITVENNMNHGVGYGTHLNNDEDSTLIFYTNWVPGKPSAGGVYILELNGSDIVKIHTQNIPGATRIHVLNNKNGSKTVIIPGVDEGQLSIDGGIASAPSWILNQEAMTWDPLGIDSGSHGSIVFDFENDGDDDVLTQNWGGTFGNKPVIFANENGTITPKVIDITNAVYGIAFIAPSIDNDSVLNLVVTDPAAVHPEWGIQTGQVTKQCKCNILISFDKINNEVKSVIPLPIAYFERNEFEGIDQIFENNNEVLSHDVSAKFIDFDYDGDEDIIIGSMIWSNDFPYGTIQLLTNDNGSYVDETDSRLFNWVLAGNAPHQLDFVDINEDGFIDIFVSDHGDSFWGVSPKLKKNGIGFGNKILINDGTGHFVVVGHHLIGKGLDYGSTMIPSISNDGIIRFTRIDGDGTNQIEVDIVEFEYRYSTGPNGRNSAELGEPDFNEFYYLLHNEDARKAVETGEFETGLEHYLSIGKSQGLKINAK